ncbi:hypothetical protein GY45DRAFT_73085 [Cubamyces sp. BRFM 1775]|nr:hypothetical protein GY45DRAFT_73085 [Cubamyces sp. BRFM 1775]
MGIRKAPIASELTCGSLRLPCGYASSLSREVGSPGSLRVDGLPAVPPQKSSDATTTYAPVQARGLQTVATSAVSMRTASSGSRRRGQLSRHGPCTRVRLGKRHDDGPLPC